MPELVTVLDGLAFPEGPRWHDGRLWFSDQHDRRVVATDADGKSETIVDVPEQPSGLGWLPDGTLLVVSMLDRKLMRYDGSALALHADLSALAPAPCNDMVVDARGRAYVGNFGYDMFGGGEYRTTNLVAVDPDGRAWEAADDLAFPNGCVVTPDGRTLIVGESAGARLVAFDIEDDGTLTNRREWAQLQPLGATADGICLDAEGAVWVACPYSNRVLRVAEGGQLLEEVAVDSGVFACALGGDDGRTLFMCSAATFDPTMTKEMRSGRIVATEVSVGAA